MATEQEYDDIIAPMLAEVADKCRELGMSVVARVEWEPNEAGITHLGITNETGIGQHMAFVATMSRGNLDSFVIHMLKNFNCDATIVKKMMVGRE